MSSLSKPSARAYFIDVRVPERAEPAETAMVLVNGVVTSYKLKGGFGRIAMLAGSSTLDLHFSISACDIKRPPSTTGERVMVTRTVGPKGPTASVVRRVSIQPETDPSPPKSKPKAKPKNRVPSSAPRAQILAAPTKSKRSEEARLGDLTRAVRVAMGTGLPLQRAASLHPPSTSFVPPEQYQSMLLMLSSDQDDQLLLPPALAIVARTQPEQASFIAPLDVDFQRIALITVLLNELDAEQQRT